MPAQFLNSQVTPSQPEPPLPKFSWEEESNSLTPTSGQSIPSAHDHLIGGRHTKGFPISITFLLLLTIVGGIAVLGMWSWGSAVDESVPGVGQLVPQGEIRKVMSPVNGIVTTLNIHKNGRVKAGDILMTLDPEQSEIEASRFEKQMTLLNEEVQALKGALTGKGNVSDPVQRAWLNSTQQAYQAELTTAAQDIEQAKHELANTQTQFSYQQKLLAKDEQLLTQYEKLYEAGGLPKNDLEEVTKNVMNRRGTVAALQDEMKARKANVQKMAAQPDRVSGRFHQVVLERVTQNEQKLAEVDANMAQANLTLSRQVIRAPIDGVVNEQAVKGTGEVVAQGQPLLSLVPDDAHLLAEIQVTNREFSYLYEGQEVILKLDAYPYQRFKKLTGKVVEISPSTVMDPEGKPYYVVRVKPDSLAMASLSDSATHPLRSGMTVSADFITRKKTLLDFLLEPITTHLDKAFKDPPGR